MVGSETVKAVAGNLKDHPVAFAIIVINMLFLVAGIWVLRDVAANARERDSLLVQIVRDCFAEEKKK
jgi:hypothetical protein